MADDQRHRVALSFSILYSFFCAHVCAYVQAMMFMCVEAREQLQEGLSSPSTIQVLGTKPSSSGLAASSFPH